MSRGHDRERAWVLRMRERGWWAMRAPGSLGIDVVAASRSAFDEGGSWLHFYEVKSTAAGPYAHFGPVERRALLLQAEKAGAEAFLVWWPPRKQPVVIPSGEWPGGSLLGEEQAA